MWDGITAVDKVAGQALLDGIDTRDRILADERAHQLGDVGQSAAHGHPDCGQPHGAHEHHG